MARWGLSIMSIGAIVMVYSQTYNDISQNLMYSIGGLVIIVLGGLMVFKGKKGTKK